VNHPFGRANSHPQLAALSMDGVVNNQDYNDGTQNHRPIGKLNARYRCLFAKPFHDYPPMFEQRLTEGETRRKVRGLYMSKFFLLAMAIPASVSALP
jgi:hypothetical protein